MGFHLCFWGANNAHEGSWKAIFYVVGSMHLRALNPVSKALLSLRSGMRLQPRRLLQGANARASPRRYPASAAWYVLRSWSEGTHPGGPPYAKNNNRKCYGQAPSEAAEEGQSANGGPPADGGPGEPLYRDPVVTFRVLGSRFTITLRVLLHAASGPSVTSEEQQHRRRQGVLWRDGSMADHAAMEGGRVR